MKVNQAVAWWICLISACCTSGHAQDQAIARSNTRPTHVAEATPQIVVGSNIQVSTAYEKDAHSETLLAASPEDRNLLLGCSIVRPKHPLLNVNDTRTIVYASMNRGESWKPTLDIDEGERRGDPACAFGLDNNAYFVETGKDPSKNGDYDFSFPDAFTRFYRSPNGGQTWLPPIILSLSYIDRPYISVDSTQGKYRGRIYVNGVGITRNVEDKIVTNLALFYSDDGGGHFHETLTSAPDGGHVILIGNSVVLSDGTVVFPFAQSALQSLLTRGAVSLKVIRSTNGGKSFEPTSTVSDFYQALGDGAEAYACPYLAADPGSQDFKDRLYLVWVDKRYDHVRIIFSFSADKGKTWSPPKVIDESGLSAKEESGWDNLLPVVAVNREGIVGVAWYDRRDNPDNLGWYVRFRASVDGGETFLPSVRVSEAPNSYGKDTQWIVSTYVINPYRASSYIAQESRGISFLFKLDSFFFRGGDTSGMAVDAAGVFHPFWVDNRTGVSQLWTAPVTVQGVAIKNGSPELRDLVDVSSKVAVEFSNVHYDRAKDLLYITIRLKNISNEVIDGPLKMRILGFKPRSSLAEDPIGRPEVVNADNGKSGAGAVWDFARLTQNNRLQPGEMSEPKHLIFHVAEVQPFRQGKRVNRVVASFDARILAPTNKSAQ